MTTIAAVQGDGWVVMGAESQGTYNEYRKIYMTDHKIVDNNGILIAGCGVGRGMNIIQKGWVAPKPRTNLTPDKLDAWMVKTFLPGMRKAFIDGGYDMKDLNEYAHYDNVFIIAVQGTVYIIDEDYSIDRDSRKYITSGSGGDFAQGSLYRSGHKLFTDLEYAKAEMRTAIDAAKEFDSNSGGETRIYVQNA